MTIADQSYLRSRQSCHCPLNLWGNGPSSPTVQVGIWKERDIKGEIKVHWFNIFKILSADMCLKTFLRIINKCKWTLPALLSLTLFFLLVWESNPVFGHRFAFYNFIIALVNFCSQSGRDSSLSTFCILRKKIIVTRLFYLEPELSWVSTLMTHTQIRTLILHKQIFSLHKEDIFSLQEFSLQI